MRSIIVFLILSISLICNCQDFDEILISQLVKHERDPSLSEIADDVSFVKLETSEESLIGSIEAITNWQDRILIMANNGKSLLVFAKEGRFQGNIGKIGKGPGEFLEIYGMAVDPKDNHLFLLDNGNGKILEFNTKLEFIQERKMPFYATGLIKTKQGFFFYTGSVYAYRNDGFLLTETTDDLTVTAKFHPRPTMKGKPDRVRTLYSDQEEIIYWEPYWDTVYSFDGKSVKTKYHFNIGKNRIPQKLLEEPSILSNNVDSYCWVVGFKEFANFLYIDFIDKNRRAKKLYFNKEDNSGYCIPGSMLYQNWGFINDFSGGPLFPLDYKMGGNEVACFYEIIDLKKFLADGLISPNRAKDSSKTKELIAMIRGSSVEENPILFIAKLK